MDKRSSTVSARIPAELETQLQAIAMVRGQTLSDLIFHALSSVCQEERERYLRLKLAFEALPDLRDKPGQVDSDLRSTTEGGNHE